MRGEYAAGEENRLLWTAAVGLLIVVSLEGILWTLTRVFMLNFDIAGPNPTILLFVLLSTGWSLAVVGRLDSATPRVYGASAALLVVGFLGSLLTNPLGAGVGAVVMVTAATPPLAGFCQALRERIVGGAAFGVLLFVGLRTGLVTASPYATTVGTALFGGIVVAAATLLVALAVSDRLPATDWGALGPAGAPLAVLLIVGAGYLAVPWTVARWALRPYWVTVGSLVAGVVAGVLVLAVRGVPGPRALLAWGGLFLAAVGVLLVGTHPATSLALAPAWASALVLVAAGTRAGTGPEQRTDPGARWTGGLQLLALLALFLSTAATHWAFLPFPLDLTRGEGTWILLGFHAVLLLSVAVVVGRSDSRQRETVAASRRSLLAAVPTAVVPFAGLALAQTDRGVEGPRDGSRVRVMTLNLHAFFEEGGGGGGYNLTAVRDLIESDGADVIAVSESDGLRPTVGHVDGLRWLGARLGYHTVFGGATRRRSYGVGLLSRWPIQDAEVLELPIERSLTRLALVATIQTPEGPVPVLSTHLSVGEDGAGENAQQAQVNRVIDRASEFERAVVMGDFNLGAASPEYEQLTDAFTDAWTAADQRSGRPETYSPSDPQERIDYVFLRGKWTVHRAATKGDSGVSDHSAVVAEIERADAGTN